MRTADFCLAGSPGIESQLSHVVGSSFANKLHSQTFIFISRQGLAKSPRSVYLPVPSIGAGIIGLCHCAQQEKLGNYCPPHHLSLHF